MPTVIKFSNSESINVAEDLHTVMRAQNTAGGDPFPLTQESDGEPVYVNPRQVTYWHDDTGDPPSAEGL